MYCPLVERRKWGRAKTRPVTVSQQCHGICGIGKHSITLEHDFQDINTRFFEIFMSFAGSVGM